jgi:hypothetical protein
MFVEVYGLIGDLQAAASVGLNGPLGMAVPAAVTFRRAERLVRTRGSCGPARVIEHVETIWRQPVDGIWAARGPKRHYIRMVGGVGSSRAGAERSSWTPPSTAGSSFATRSTLRCADMTGGVVPSSTHVAQRRQGGKHPPAFSRLTPILAACVISTAEVDVKRAVV